MAAEEGIRVKFTGDATSLETAAKRGVTALKSFNTASGQATNTLTNFSRVVQDAPFGIIGIANNIDPLVQSFQALKAQTGSAGSAFKSLLGQLAGPAGLALGVSVVTSLLITFSDRLFGAGKAAKDTAEKLKSLADLRKEANKDIAQELTQVQQLKIVLESENTTRKEKEAALKRLKQINPDYFGDLKFEKGLVNGLTTAYQGYLRSIQARSEVKVLEKQLDQLNEQILNLENPTVRQFIQGLNKDLLKSAKESGNTALAYKLSSEFSKLDAENQKKINNLLFQRESILGQMAQRAKDIEVSGVDLKPDKIEKIDVPELQLRAARVGLTIGEFLVEKSTIQNRFDIAGLIDTGKITPPDLPGLVLPEPDPEQIKRIQGYFSSIGEFAAQAAEAISVGLGGAFTTLFEGIFSGSQSAFQAFGQALGNIIKRLLATAAAAAVLTFILGPLGLVKGSSGAALKGFDLFKNLFGKIGGFAEGGVVQGPQTGYPAILHGKEVVAPFDKFVSLMQGAGGMNDGRLTMEVRGEKLLFAVDRARRGRNIIS